MNENRIGAIDLKYIDSIKIQAEAIITLIQTKDSKSVNFKNIISRHLIEQNIIGINLAIEAYELYLPKKNSPLLDVIKAIKEDLKLFQRTI